MAFLFCLLVIFWGFTDIHAVSRDQSFADRQRPPVRFLDEQHDNHMDGFDCLTCHHRYENGENVLDEFELEEGNPDISCSACHHAGAQIGLRKAYHDQCIGCHNRYNDKEGSALPVYCGECHIRQAEEE